MPRKSSKPHNGTKTHKAKEIAISALTPHPRNYRGHPPDQVEHIKASLREHGFYRNVVIAKDDVILAGHGVVEASQALGMETVPVVRLPIASDSPQALKVLTGDNTIGQQAFDDDRILTNLLKELSDEGDLLGTGFDDSQLAALLMVTRPAAEIKDFDAAAEWVGMPDYDAGETRVRLVISFVSEDDRERFVDEKGIEIGSRGTIAWSTRWPWTERNDPKSIRFKSNG